MYDFEKLQVYQRVQAFHLEIRNLLNVKKPDKYVKDQLLRASMSVMLNIAEGSGRFSKADKRNFYVIARSSVFECVALLNILKYDTLIDETDYLRFYSESEEISKILYAIIVNLQSIDLKK